MGDGFSDSDEHRNEVSAAYREHAGDLYTTKFLDALKPMKKARFTVEEICKCIGIKRRSFYRIVKGEKKADFNEMISAQTAAITVLTMQIKARKP